MRRSVGWTAAALAIALAVVAVVLLLERAPGGPVEPAWDRQACAHCRMHLSERGFAAQLQDARGEVWFFDDPGCLWLWQRDHGAAAAEIYYHHLREERWLTEAQAGFARVETTPMGWGFGAVERSAADALAPETARAEVLAGSGRKGAGDGRPAH